MSQFLNETFTEDTAGAALDGSAWTKVTSSTAGGSAQITASKAVRPSSTTTAIYLATATPGSANYTVTATPNFANAATGDQAGVGARATSNDSGYYAIAIANYSTVIVRRDAGAGSLIGTAGPALTAGQTLGIQVSGSTINALINGSVVATATDTTYTAAGSAAIEFSSGGTPSDTAGPQILSVTGNAVVAPSTATIASTNAAWASSPGNWTAVGSTLVSSDFGAERTTTFTGSTTCALTFDVSALTGASVAAGSYPQIRYTLNADVATDVAVAGTVTLATNLTAGTTYTLRYFYVRGDFTVDAYATPVMAIRETGLVLDSGATVSAPTGLPSDEAMVFGDSITAGLIALSNNNPAGQDATVAFGKVLGVALGSQVGLVGKPSQGWAWAGSGDVPAFPAAWKLAWQGQSRTFPTLRRAIVVEGTNDALNNVSDATVSAAVQGWMTDARTTLGSATWIHVVVPFGGFKRAAIQAGFAAYKAANPTDVRVGNPDLGTGFQVGLSPTYGVPMLRAPYDGIHLSAQFHGQAGAALATQIALIEGLPATSTVTSGILFGPDGSLVGTAAGGGAVTVTTSSGIVRQPRSIVQQSGGAVLAR